MDLVGWDEPRFRAIEAEFADLAKRLDVSDATAIPIAALHGDNVVEPSAASPWYDGPPLLEHLEQVEVLPPAEHDALRLPVQWVIRPADGDGRLYAGQVAAGVLRPGDEVAVLPRGTRTTVATVETFDGPLQAAAPPQSVAVRLAEDIDVGRGDLICTPDSLPPNARELEATICWMGDAPLRPGARYALKHTTRSVRATVQSLIAKLDITTLDAQQEPAEPALNDIGRVTLRTSAPIFADPYAANRVTGAFILVDEHGNDTVAAGLVRSARELPPPPARRRDVTWHDSGLDRDRRWRALGHGGATVWLTGLPASGKSTIAVALERRLVGPAVPHTCSTATTCATGCRTTSDSSRAIARSTSAVSGTSHGSSPTPAWWRWCRWSRRSRPTARWRARSTTARSWTSSRSTSPRRSPSVNGAIQRVSTRGRARGRFRASPGSGLPTRRRRRPSCGSTPRPRTSRPRSSACLDALRRQTS